MRFSIFEDSSDKKLLAMTYDKQVSSRSIIYFFSLGGWTTRLDSFPSSQATFLLTYIIYDYLAFD